MENAIARYMQNAVIMEFVTTVAREQVAADIRAKTGSGTTAKAVEILEVTNPNVKDRLDQYIASGLVGCYLASQK